MVGERPFDDELQRLREERLRNMEARFTGRSGGVIEISDTTFREALQKHPALVVDVWAEWCGPCRMAEPVLEELASNFQGKVSFFKVNVDENQDLASNYGVMSIPTAILFKDGKEVSRQVGFGGKEAFEELLKKTV